MMKFCPPHLSRQGWASLLTLLTPLLASGNDFTPDQIEFFENKIRPVLAQECYECHNSRDKAKSGLVLDYRDGLIKGGDLGPSVVPGKPDESILMEALRHEYDLEMPKAGVKLDPPIVADFEKWIAMGAPDPRDKPPTDEELASDTSWDAILETRKNWWSFQPIRKPESPSSVDAFIDRKLDQNSLEKSAPAEPRVVARRLYFALTGLPPTPEELDQFHRDAAADPDKALEHLTDDLLSRPAFGERWARHWMDWIRYAESHGSEGDPRIDNAHLYRDYLIRALNADIPYDQLLREHVAGDLLSNPRYNREKGINESIIATAHWRMVFHGFAPTDALDEKVRFTDDQINVFTKAFQALTVSCARCHNHKFDAISQADYYALFGIFGSTRPGRKLINEPATLEKNREALAKVKPQIRESLYSDWQSAINNVELPEELQKNEKQFDAFAKRWEEDHKRRSSHGADDTAGQWDLSSEKEYASWFKYGNGLPDKPTKAGAFTLHPEGKKVVAQILPAGAYSHLLSDKHAARLTSKDFLLEDEYELLIHARGNKGAMVRYVVQNYPRKGTVFKVNELGQKGETGWKWHKFDLAYWKGDQIHIELATAKDAPLLTKNEDRSWFGIREAVLVKKGDSAPYTGISMEHLDPLMEAKGDTLQDRYRNALTSALNGWKSEKLTDAQALLLEWALNQGSLPNTVNKLPSTAPLLVTYRELESQIRPPVRVHGLDEWAASDQPLYDRGDHKKPLEEVPRRFLDAIDPTPYEGNESGRLQLAEDLLREDNPFTRRVIVNRVWHHLFGQGIVPTADNFGRMGEKPSHPELMDHLAVTFSDEFDWSIKRLIKHLVTTDVFRRSGTPSADAQEKDPDNRLLSHFTVKRLEAEAVRDALLKVSGILDDSRYGPPVNGSTPRRSVYVNVIRNQMDPFLGVYDAPVPFSTTGRRSETNVPAQSLTMLNSPFVVNTAGAFARSISRGETEARISEMWKTALGREITPTELEAANSFFKGMEQQAALIQEEKAKLNRELATLVSEKRSLLDPARKRLEEVKSHTGVGDSSKTMLDPIGAWDFAQGLSDLVGEQDLELVGDARLEDDSLLVSGNGFARSAPLPHSLKAKTLHVRLLLDDLKQKGGGAMTIQDLQGSQFDSIVFAERKNGHWLSGSNNHKRTREFEGTEEKEASSSPVAITITYTDDGTVRGFRNGEPYGKPYDAGSVASFEKEASRLVFGLRHGNAVGGNRMLKGRILEASLFDRALSEEEVSALANTQSDFISPGKIFESLTEAQQTRVQEIDSQLARLELQLDEVGTPPDENSRWQNFAHSIFNLKEFIYVY